MDQAANKVAEGTQGGRATRATHGPSAMAAHAIPKTFHYIWLGSGIPQEHERYIDTWKVHHPEWNFCFWDDVNNVVEMPLSLRHIYEDAHEYVPDVGANVWQLRSDILRLQVVAKFGGVYIDTDLECLRPIDELASSYEGFAAWEEDDVYINNAIFGFPRGHRTMYIMMDILEQRAGMLKGAGKRANVISGPHLWTQAWEDFGPEELDMTVHPSRYFYPYRWDHLHRGGEEFPDSYAVHHWNNQRRKAGLALP